jgi:ABC-type transport system substrate-binding protein
MLLIPLMVDTAMAAKKKSRFFEVTLLVPIGNVSREKAGQIIARDLEKIGIGVNLRYMEFATLVSG